jgi:prepilin peptidase CpaA
MVDALVAIVTLFCAATDVRTGKIYNAVTYPAVAAGLAAAAAGGGPDVHSALLGLLAGGLPLYLMFAFRWMGGGDVKLMAAVGAIKGFPFALTALFYSIFVGGVCAAVLLIWGGHGSAVLGDVRTMARRSLPGASAAPIPARGGAFPFGLAICVGTFIAIALEHLG